MAGESPGPAGGLLARLVSGSQVAGYRLEAQVGAGGTAVVFAAVDERLGRRVALKVLAPGLAADPGFRQRFMRESRAAAAVEDPHIIPVYEAGEADGVLFIAMRFVSGGDLRSLLRREGPLTPARAAELISPVASALDAAHGAGLVHRDVKPANVLVDARPGRPDHVYLSDFGLSKGAVSSVGLTGSGQFLGTPDYAAPEQISGRAVDARADQYALACVAFELLAGAAPFGRAEPMAVLWAHVSEPPPSLAFARPDLPRSADQILARALEKAPENRYACCRDLADALRDAFGLPRYNSSAAGADQPRAQPAPPDEAEPGRATVSPDVAAAGMALTIIPVPTPGAQADTPPAQPETPGQPDTPTGEADGQAAAPGVPLPSGLVSDVPRGAPTPPARQPRHRRARVAAVAVIVLAAGAVIAALVTPAPHRPPAAAGHRATPARHASTTHPAKHAGSSTRNTVSAGPRIAVRRFATLTDGIQIVDSVAFSPDGRTLATADGDDSTYLWNVASGSQIATLTDPGDNTIRSVTSVAFSPDGRTLAAGDSNDDTYLWNVASGSITAALAAPGTGHVDSVAFSPDGKTLATADSNGSTYLWNVASGSQTATLAGPGQPTAVAFSPDGKTLAAADGNGRTYLWDLATRSRTALTDPRSGQYGVESVAFSPDGKTLATGDSNGSGYLWNVATGSLTATLTDPGSQGDGADAVAFTPDGRTLATANWDGSTYLWDVATGGRIATVTDPGSVVFVISAAFSPDGRTLATGDGDGSAYLWRVAGGGSFP